jgi:hypothetical protein
MTQDQRLEALLDRQDIYDCLVRFCRGMDRFDRELFLSAFHNDATISAGSFVGDAVALYDWASELHRQGQSATQHNLLNHSCEIEGETAHTETYYLFVGRNIDDSNWLAGGRYIDRLEKRDGEWRIAFRHNVIEWSGMQQGMELPFADVTDLNGNGAPARDRSDISYRRPLVNQRSLNLPD